jgi:hypothetical protein
LGFKLILVALEFKTSEANEMAPPSFGDLGKSARDILTKTYNFGFLKIDSTTRSGQLEFKTNASHDQLSKNFGGGLEVKYDFPKHGMTVVEKWNTKGILVTELTVQDKLVEGAKVGLETTFDAAGGKRSGLFKSSFKNDKVHFNVDSTVNTQPVVSISGVARHQDWLAGAKVIVDSAKANKIPQHHLIVAYTAPAYEVAMFQRNGTHFGSSIYHKVNREVELAANAEWNQQGQDGAKLTVGGKFLLDDFNVLKARVSNNSEVAVALTHTLRPGFKANLSAQANLKAMNDGASHKFGLGLEYESK